MIWIKHFRNYLMVINVLLSVVPMLENLEPWEIYTRVRPDRSRLLSCRQMGKDLKPSRRTWLWNEIGISRLSAFRWFHGPTQRSMGSGCTSSAPLSLMGNDKGEFSLHRCVHALKKTRWLNGQQRQFSSCFQWKWVAWSCVLPAKIVIGTIAAVRLGIE